MKSTYEVNDSGCRPRISQDCIDAAVADYLSIGKIYRTSDGLLNSVLVIGAFWLSLNSMDEPVLPKLQGVDAAPTNSCSG
jgi:hypothetical protein